MPTCIPTSLFKNIKNTVRRDRTSHLYPEDCTCATDHWHQGRVIWNSFRERLGISEIVQMLFGLSSLIDCCPLPVLDEPLSKEELDHGKAPLEFENQIFMII